MSGPQAQPIRGAQVDPAELIAARFSARYLNVSRSNRALAHLAGAKRSQRRGRGVEFEEVRQYAAGDDIRAIDWRVTARSGDAHTKLFHEERERPVLVAADLRQSMQFGSRNCFKSVLAAYTASLLLWSALERGERIGGMVFTGTQPQDIRPARSRRAALAMIGELAKAPGELTQELALDEQLRQIQRIARPGSTLFLLSDFQEGLLPGTLEALRSLVRHVQIIAIQITDPLERELPKAGRYVVADPSGRSALETGSTKLRERYRAEFEAHQAELKQQYRGLRIPIINLFTEDSPLPVLQRYFPVR